MRNSSHVYDIRGCFMHFLHLLAVWRPGARSARDNHLLARNFARYLPILKILFPDRLINKHLLIRLLTTPPHLKYVATLPCIFLVIACF